MSAPVGAAGPCIGLLELASIATGLEVVDAICKQAGIQLRLATTLSPGKYIVLFDGPVDEVSSALRRGTEVGAEALLDQLFIPNVEPTLLALVHAGAATTLGAHDQGPESLDREALGVLETLSVASTIRAADLASKTASLTAVGLHLARGIGGKSWVAFRGEVSDVEAGIEAGAADAVRHGLLVRRLVIPNPHASMATVLAGGFA